MLYKYWTPLTIERVENFVTPLKPGVVEQNNVQAGGLTFLRWPGLPQVALPPSGAGVGPHHPSVSQKCQVL